MASLSEAVCELHINLNDTSNWKAQKHLTKLNILMKWSKLTCWKTKSNTHQSCIKINDIIESYIDGLVQDSSNSIANALELLQSCT